MSNGKPHNKDVFLEAMKKMQKYTGAEYRKEPEGIPPLNFPIHNCPYGPDDALYQQGSLPIKSFQKLKQGKMTIEDTLNLRGLTRDESLEKLQYFLYSSYNSNHRTVLIIHGKGHHSQGPNWIKNDTLTSLKNHPLVIALASAKPKDGGEGSVYIRLRNPNKTGENT